MELLIAKISDIKIFERFTTILASFSKLNDDSLIFLSISKDSITFFQKEIRTTSCKMSIMVEKMFFNDYRTHNDIKDQSLCFQIDNFPLLLKICEIYKRRLTY